MNEIELLSSIKHPAIVQAKTDLTSMTGAWHERFAIEGQGMLRQALAAGVRLQQVFFREPVEGDEVQALTAELIARGIPCYRVTPGVFSRILALGYETSTRILAIVRPAPVRLEELEKTYDEHAVVLAGECIQDPRNVGVLIRNADGWGVKLAIFADSADAYSRASVRSTTGSILRLPIMQTPELLPALSKLKGMGFKIIGSSAAGTIPLWEARLTHPCVICVGNESTGLSDPVRRYCDELVKIPMYGGAHSFNVTVAAGVLLYEATRNKG